MQRFVVAATLQLLVPIVSTRYLPVLLYAQYHTLLPVAPLCASRYLTLLLDLFSVHHSLTAFRFHQRLEEAVLPGLVPVVGTTATSSLLSSALMLCWDDRQLLRTHLSAGLSGLIVGAMAFHVTLVLFGAPVVEYVLKRFLRTLLLILVLVLLL